jgi:pseudouridine-5'-phosphate glycosidase
MESRVSRLRVSAEVAAAVSARGPLVALETTVVTHGLPPPAGLEVAAEMEAAVRNAGAIPATIGVLDGRASIGLTTGELERLASSRDVAKANLGNLAAIVAGGGPGSTTVAATLLLAHRAGIGVLATGGIGGVHRDAAQSGDVSADLTALSRFPVAVVCSGAKAVLDLPRTLEALETLGVPVYGVGTDRFPAFYRRDSGLPVDAPFGRMADLAAALRAHWELRLSGAVVANPVPPELEMPRELYENSLERALQDASAAKVRGRDVTPFLLERMSALTARASVATNRALLVHNARIAGELAVALTE